MALLYHFKASDVDGAGTAVANTAAETWPYTSLYNHATYELMTGYSQFAHIGNYGGLDGNVEGHGNVITIWASANPTDEDYIPSADFILLISATSRPRPTTSGSIYASYQLYGDNNYGYGSVGWATSDLGYTATIYNEWPNAAEEWESIESPIDAPFHCAVGYKNFGETIFTYVDGVYEELSPTDPIQTIDADAGIQFYIPMFSELQILNNQMTKAEIDDFFGIVSPPPTPLFDPILHFKASDIDGEGTAVELDGVYTQIYDHVTGTLYDLAVYEDGLGYILTEFTGDEFGNAVGREHPVLGNRETIFNINLSPFIADNFRGMTQLDNLTVVVKLTNFTQLYPFVDFFASSGASYGDGSDTYNAKIFTYGGSMLRVAENINSEISWRDESIPDVIWIGTTDGVIMQFGYSDTGSTIFVASDDVATTQAIVEPDHGYSTWDQVWQYVAIGGFEEIWIYGGYNVEPPVGDLLGLRVAYDVAGDDVSDEGNDLLTAPVTIENGYGLFTVNPALSTYDFVANIAITLNMDVITDSVIRLYVHDAASAVPDQPLTFSQSIAAGTDLNYAFPIAKAIDLQNLIDPRIKVVVLSGEIKIYEGPVIITQFMNFAIQVANDNSNLYLDLVARDNPLAGWNVGYKNDEADTYIRNIQVLPNYYGERFKIPTGYLAGTVNGKVLTHGC